MGLTVRQWRHWRHGKAKLWLAERRYEWESLAEEEAVVVWHCAAGRAGLWLRTAVMLRWSSLFSAVWLCGDVTVSLGKWSSADCGDGNGLTVLCRVSEDGTLVPKRLGVSIIIKNCIVLRAFVCACIDFTDVRVMSRTTKRKLSVLHALSITKVSLLCGLRNRCRFVRH
jgi:hypothetical protein